MRHAESREILTLAEMADEVRIPAATLRFWRHKGTGPRSFTLGGRVMYKREDIDAWIDEEYQAGQSGGPAESAGGRDDAA